MNKDYSNITYDIEGVIVNSRNLKYQWRCRCNTHIFSSQLSHIDSKFPQTAQAHTGLAVF